MEQVDTFQAESNCTKYTTAFARIDFNNKLGGKKKKTQLSDAQATTTFSQ